MATFYGMPCIYYTMFLPEMLTFIGYLGVRVSFSRHYVDTVGRNREKIAAYIRQQLDDDVMADQISFKEYIDPFTGSKNPKA